MNYTDPVQGTTGRQCPEHRLLASWAAPGGRSEDPWPRPAPALNILVSGRGMDNQRRKCHVLNFSHIMRLWVAPDPPPPSQVSGHPPSGKSCCVPAESPSTTSPSSLPEAHWTVLSTQWRDSQFLKESLPFSVCCFLEPGTIVPSTNVQFPCCGFPPPPPAPVSDLLPLGSLSLCFWFSSLPPRGARQASSPGLTLCFRPHVWPYIPDPQAVPPSMWFLATSRTLAPWVCSALKSQNERPPRV